MLPAEMGEVAGENEECKCLAGRGYVRLFRECRGTGEGGYLLLSLLMMPRLLCLTWELRRPKTYCTVRVIVLP